MKAIICNEWCKPEELKILEVENPILNSDAVRIQVEAAGVNLIAIKMIYMFFGLNHSWVVRSHIVYE